MRKNVTKMKKGLDGKRCIVTGETAFKKSSPVLIFTPFNLFFISISISIITGIGIGLKIIHYIVTIDKQLLNGLQELTILFPGEKDKLVGLNDGSIE